MSFRTSIRNLAFPFNFTGLDDDLQVLNQLFDPAFGKIHHYPCRASVILTDNGSDLFEGFMADCLSNKEMFVWGIFAR